MAKETTIIFVYDTELLKKEEDDPNSAILYFYPTWVSDQQKTTLCGQLMGTTRCLKTILSMPKIISLQTGNFYLIENGRYILVVGTDRNTPGWILEERATLIYSLINFFHKDFISLAQLYKNESLINKLYHIFDTYLKLLFLGGCIFHQTPLMDFKTENSNILKNSKLFLDNCKSIPNVLGGMLLYHNKVIHTQLSVSTTKKIIFSDPFRIKNPAELTNLNYEIPQGVKLLQVFIPKNEFQELYKNCLQNEQLADTEPLLPSTSLKRDTSLLFTTVPEDSNSFTKARLEKKGKRSRPNFLKLKNTGDSYMAAGKSPNTPYWNQFSSVSTPMSENKSFIDPEIRATKNLVWDLSTIKFKKDCAKNHQNNFKMSLNKAIKAALKSKSKAYRKSSIDNIPNSISQQYSKSIKLRRCNSIHDPNFPWSKNDNVALSQYYVEDILGFKVKKVSIVERKKSLTLPIKPHNASEGQKSPVGYCTPLMNKLAMPANSNNSFEKQNYIKPRFTDKDLATSEENRQLQRCILFVYGERDLVVSSLLATKDINIIEKLRQLCFNEICSLEKQINMPIEELGTSDYSILSFDQEWGTLKRFGPWDNSSLDDLKQLHRDFHDNNKINEIYLRKADSILYANHSDSTEIYYQESASQVNGLLSPSDTLATVHHTAKKRLEKNHGLSLLKK